MSHKTGINQYFIENPHAESHIWEKGEFICRERSLMTRLYYLDSGRCRVFRDLSSGLTILYRIYLPGAVLGDIELFTGMDASCSVQCMTEARALSIPMKILRDNTADYSEMLFRLAGGIARKMHENTINDSIDTAYSLEIRLAHYYLAFTDPMLKADNLGQLAAWMGCSYRHLTRSHAHLVSIGALRKSGTGYSADDACLLEGIAAPLLNENQARGLFERGDY